MNPNQLRQLAQVLLANTREPVEGSVLTPNVYAMYTIRRLADVLNVAADSAENG